MLEQYRGVFEKIYIFSPSINIDDGWIPVKKYIKQDLEANTEREQAYYDEWDEAALRSIIQRQRKITKTSKKLEMKKLYQVLIILDNYAESPQLHKPHGALDTLFIRVPHLTVRLTCSADVSGGQQVFKFVRMMAYSEVYLRPAGQRQPRVGQSEGRHPVQDHAEERRGHGSDDGHLWRITLRHLRFRDRPERASRPTEGLVLIVRVVFGSQVQAARAAPAKQKQSPRQAH